MFAIDVRRCPAIEPRHPLRSRPAGDSPAMGHNRHAVARMLPAILLSVAPAFAPAATGGEESARGPDATFSVREAFGVSHPDQVIDFDLPGGAADLDPNSTVVLDAEG